MLSPNTMIHMQIPCVPANQDGGLGPRQPIGSGEFRRFEGEFVIPLESLFVKPRGGSIQGG